MRIGVTGFSSEIGQAVQDYALAYGHKIEGLGRRQEHRHFDVKRNFDPACLEGLDGLIHLAWDRDSRKGQFGPSDPNVKAAAQLFEACSQMGIPAVLLSSSSAAQPNKSQYGAAKQAAEESAGKFGFPSLRAGLVWGGGLPPILQTLQRLASLPVVLPLPNPGMPLDHNHDSHVARALVSALSREEKENLVRSLASPELVTSTEVLEAFRWPRSFVRLPVPARLAARTARRVRDSSALSNPRLDSIALLDINASELAFDPHYPEELGREAFLNWISMNDRAGFL